ncbi:LEPR-XLL domain-containing protein, partial [Mesorhizobium sp. M7A.F.Ca.CA.004.01.1.1]
MPNLALEALEPRYLLSADILPFAVDMNDLAGADYSLRYDNLIQAIQIYDNKSDTLIDQRNVQQIDYIVVRGTDADDKLTIDFGENFLAALDVRFDGGAGNDTLAMTGGSFDAVRLATDTGLSGSITAQAGALTHSIGLANVGAVEDDTTASQRIYADTSGQARVIRIGSSDDSNDGLSVLDAGTFNNLIAYKFATPAVSLTVDAGAGDDSFVLREIDPALAGRVVLSGGAGSDAVVGPPRDTDWHLTGEGSGDVAGVSFVTVENLIGSAGNEDTFFVGAAGRLSGVMAGGDAGFDSMVLDGGTFASVKYAATGQTSGTITRDGVVLRYDGLEPIIDNSVVADRVITTSNADDEATLTDNGATLTLSSDSLISTFESITFNKPSTSLTINLGDDLGIPILSKDTLTINAVNLGSTALIINGQDGKDEVTISGTLTAGAVTVNAEKISVSSTINASSMTLTAAAADDGKITGGAYFATPEAIIDLSGATIIVTGAAQFTATATANVEAETFEVGPLAGVIATILPEARVKFSSTNVTAASLSASSTVTVTLTAKDESDAGSDNDEKKDAAVSVTVLVSDAITEVLAGSVLSVSGAVSLTATSNLTMTTEADGGSGGKGASVAVSEVNATTRANVSGGSTIGANAGDTPNSIALGATLISNITTIAKSTAGGSDQSAGGDNESEERLKDPNKDGITSDKATTSSGDITFAGAVTVSDYRPTTEAFVQASTLTSGGAITLTAQSTDKVTATADGTNTNSSSNGATGIGVAVALSIADVTTRSYLGGASSLSASAVSLSATIAAGDSFIAQATSGAGEGSKTQVAGSLAINIVITEASADVAANASINLNGADLSLTANSTTNVVTDAVPDDASGAAGELGIGGSVALTIVDNSTSASIRDNATIVAGDAITMIATGNHTAATKAEAGAEGGDVGIGGAVAIDVIDNNTESSIGSGGELDITGNLSASASNHGVSTTLADGDAIGSTAIGAAIALAFVDNRAFSTSNRNLRSNGSISLSAANDGSSKAESIASAAGAEKDEDGNTKADEQRDKEVGLANSKSNDGDSASKSANSSGGSGGGDVSVAAALALNVSSSLAVASINDGRTVVAGDGAGVGELNLQSSNNMDATAKADGTAKTSDSGTAVGVAVAINIATMRNEASIGAGSIITADGVKAEAKMKNVGGDVTHRFGAESTSGASGGDIGVAGSFALSFADTDTLGVIGLDHADQPASGAATVTLTGGNVLLTAINTTVTTTTATSSGAGSGSGSVGVGASIALGIGLNTTFAGIENGETVSGTTGNFTVTATSNDTLTTTAKAGAEGATGIGGAIAVAYFDNDTDAHIGTGGGATITLTGNLAAQASHTGTVHTLADGEAAGSSVGVGASIALNIGEVTNDAFLGRNFQNVGTVTITATSMLDTKAESKASSKGQSTKKSDGTTDSASSDQETTNQTEMAKNQSGGTKTPSQSGGSSLGQADSNSNAQTGKGTQGGNGSGGTNVAATIAVNFLDADNQAQIAGDVTIAGTGAMKVEAISTTDARALATATSTNTSSNTGVAAAIGLNIVLLDNNAMIGSNADLTAGSIEVRAATGNGQKNTFQARALSGAVSKNTAVGGSVGVNYLDVDTLASVGDNVDLDANTGNIEIGAVSLNEMQNLAGGAALSTGSGGGGVGIAVTVNIVNDLNTKAQTGINLDAEAQGAINVTSHAELLPISEDLPVIGSLAVTSFAAGIAGASGGFAVGGSSSVNVIFMETHASVNDNSDLEAGTGIKIEATDLLTVVSGAGGIGLTLNGNAGVGIGLDVQVITRNTSAWMGGGADLDTTAGNIIINADSFDDITSIAATFGGSAGGSAGVAASVGVLYLDTSTQAFVEAGSTLNKSHLGAGGDVSVTATGDADVFLLAGAAAFGQSAGIGISGTVFVHLDDVKAELYGDADVVTGGANGLSVSAISTDDVLIIAAAGAASAQAAVAGSVAVTVLTETTTARIGANSKVSGQTLANDPGVSVFASDETDILTIAGSLAVSAGSAGVGAGVNVSTLTKTTTASIEAGADIDVDGNVTVEATGNEDIGSFSVAAGASSGAGVTLTADVFVLNLKTRAFIGSDPLAPIGGLTDVRARGSVLVQALDETEMDLIVGGVAIGGSAGVGVAAGVAVVDKVTDAFIGAGARVTGEGHGTVAARTGRYQIEYAGSQAMSSFDPQGGNKPTASSLEAGTPSGLTQFKNLDQEGGDDVQQDPGLTQNRVATASVDTGFRGVAVSASAKDDVETFAISVGGGGSVGVAVGAAVNVVDTKTKAFIGADAQINQDMAGPGNAGQSVLVAAASDFSHVGVGAGAAFGGSGAGAPGVDVSVIKVDTVATINDGADVKANNDVAVIATSKEKVIVVSAGLAFSGTVSLAGGVSVLSFDTETYARVGANATIVAGGDVAVMAKDDSEVVVVAGAVAIGLSGGGAAGSVAVVNVDKLTEATIGDNASIDASGNGAGIGGVLTGTIVGGGDPTSFGAAEAHGVIVQAESSEEVTNVTVAGAAGLYVGLAGSVTVTLLNSDTKALIGVGADINQGAADYLAHPGTVSGAQGVYVNAANEVRVTSFAGALGAGFVGLAGGIDFGSIKNDTVAAINANAMVRARGDVSVNAVAIKVLRGFAFSGGVGVAGLGASVSVWSIGEAFTDSYQDNQGGSGNATKDDGSSKTANDEAGEQADGGVAGITGELGRFGSGANSNTADSRVKAGVEGARDKVGANALTSGALTNKLTAAVTDERGTTASVEGGATVEAGYDIVVNAREQMKANILVGSLGAGLVGLGASISVVNVSGQVRAKAGGNLKAGNAIRLESHFGQNIDVTTVALQAGFVGLGASVAVVNDTSRVQAGLLDNTVVNDAASLTVSATSNQTFDVLTTGIQAGAVAVGASYSDVTIGDDDDNTKEVLATIGTGSQIGQVDAVGAITVHADSTINVDSDTFALAAGLGALTFNFAFIDVQPNVEASIGSGANISATGLLTVEAWTLHDATGDIFALSVGALAAGTSLATVNVVPTVTASIGGNSTVHAGGIVMLSSHNYQGETATDRGAKAYAEASGGGLFSGQGSVPTARSNAVANTTIGAGGAFTITGDINIKSRVRNYAVANAEANSFGAAAVGASVAEAEANGQSNAAMNANIVSVTDIMIEALAVNGALAVAEAAGGGVLGALTINSAVATASPSSVSASIGNNTSIQSARNVRLKAQAQTEGDAKVVGISIGGIFGAGASDATTHVSPTVASSIGAGAVINATGDILVEASASPIPGVQPTYEIVDVDGTANTITVNGHGLVTGDTVEYDAGSGGAVIPGLNWPDPDDSAVNRQYSVINVVNAGVTDPNTLYFGSVFNAADIDPNTEIIEFAGGHNFLSGDAVRYYPGPDETVDSFGLTEGNLYYVLVIDGSHIKLVGTFDKAVNPQNYLKNFQPDDVAGNSITIAAHGFVNGTAVTYEAPDARTFVSRQVDVNSSSLNPDGSPIADANADDIRFFDDDGNALAHGFVEGEHVVYDVKNASGGTGLAIGGLVDGQTYRVHVVNSSTIQLKRNDAITEEVQFVRNAAGDRIIRTDGLNWADNGFAAGTLFIGGGGANSGTFTIASVSGSTLILTVANSVTAGTQTKTFDQPIIALAPNKGLSANPALNVGASDIHSLVNAKNLPIGGLEDGKTYYVRGVSGPGDNTFELWNAPSGGSQIALTPTAIAGPYGNHSLTALAVDISAAADSEQQLRIDINDSATSASPGQFLFGPGEVPLSEIAPQSGDGVSSAYAKGSGGGFVGVQINDADIISNPNVSATISATQITTVGNVTVSTSVTTNTSSYAVNGTGGFVAIGDADARSYQDIISAATISDNTRITAGKNFTLASASNAITSAASQSSAGGAVGLADPTTDVRIEYNTVSTIGSNAIVLAGQLAKATANASVDVTAKSTASGIGFGGDGDAITHVNIGSPDVDPDADQADAIVSLAANAVLSARRTSLAARVDNFHVFSGSDGRGAGFYGEGEAESTITARPDAQVRINAGADLTGWEGVDLITRYDNVDTHAKSYARSTGLFGFVDSDAHNDTDVSSEIFGAAGALVTAGPRDNSDVVLGHPDYPQEPGSSAEHLALFASTVNGPNIAQTDNADDSKRSLAAGGSSGSSPDDRPQSINFNSDVLILSGRSPELVIKQLVVGAEGQIDVAVEVSVNDTAGGGSATEGEGSTIQSNDIVVNNIVNPGPGDVVFDSNSMIGAGGTWTFRDTLQRVSIRNESDKDIIINNIDVVTDEQPLAWLNPSQSVTLTFKVVREVAPTLVEITDTGGHSDIYINGTIDNPIGTTSIVNTDGSVFATNDRGVTGSDGRQSLIRTHILNIRADENIGATGARVNIDIVDSAGLPLGIGFDTGRVAGLTNQVFLGVENRFYTGQLVRYDAVTTAIGGLTDGGYYYIIASPDGQSVKLATTLTNALAGTAIDLAPGGALTDLHSLISAETFTTDALGNISLDLKALLREAPAGGFYIVEIDRINAGNTADVLLQASIEQFGDGLSGGLLVKAPALPAGGQTYYNKFRPDEGAIPSLSRGVFATGNTEIASTYDFRGLDPATGLRTLPGLQAGSVVTGGDIIVAAANPAPSATTINVLGITEIAGNGDIDVLTNGYIALTEKTGDMRIERIRSNASDVLLYSPRRILDARNDNGDPTSIEADVSGRNITMAAGVGLFNPTHFQVAAEVLNPTLLDINSALGGIGEPGNFLEINVDNRNGAGGLGVLRAFDISADATLGIFLDEVVGDMHVHTVHTIRDVSLRTVAGSILDSRNNGLGDDLADVMGQTIDLDANGNGSIGAFTNDLEIDSSRGSSDDDVALEAGNNIYLAEAPEVPGGTAGNLRLVLAHTYDGDIRITVRETSVQGENLDLLHSGSARFGEDGTTFPTFQPDASRAIPHGQIFAEKGSVLLRVGDNVTLDSNSETLAAKSIDIYGDVSATNEVIHALVNLDFAFGTVMVLRGRIIANATVTPGNKTIGAPVGSATPTLTANPVTGPTVLTRIFGNTDVDTIQFGDTSGAGGTNTQGSAGYVFLGSKTRAYGSQNLDVNNVDGEDRFRVYYLQDTTTQTSPNMQTAAEHTLTLDGVSGTDLYEIYTLGSNNPGQGTAGTDFQRNYVINILDSGRPIDGVDELTIFGYDSSQNGLIGGNKPIDDIFLLRGANYLPHEAADRPGYVAMVYGQPKTYADTIEDNEPSNEVARINYDTALNGRITIEGQGGNDNFYSDDTTAIVSLQGGAGDDSFNIGQIFGTKRTGDAENGVTPFFGGNLLDQDVFPDMVATTRGWLSPGISAPMVAQGGTGNDEFRVYANQAELRLEGDDNNDLFIVRAFAIAAVANQDWNGDGTIDQDDLPAVTLDTNGDGVINFADADSTPDDYTDDVIVLDDFGVAKSIIGLGFSVARAPDIRAGGGEDEVQYNVNAPVSVDGGTGFDKLVILGTEFADDFAITDKGIFGAGLNVRYTTIEVVEVDGLEGDDEFFVQSTAFGVAYRVIGGLGSDTINVAGDVTEDIITRELEGASGAVDHLVTSGDPLYDGVLVDGFDYHVAGPQEGIVRIDETDGFTAVREGGPRNVDSYTVRLAVAPLAGQIVYVTISAARSPQQEEDGTLINPAPLPNGIGDTIWLSKLDPGAVGTDGEFQHVITINGVPTIINDRSIVLAFDSTNWNTAQNVYLYAPDDLRAEGDRVVVVQHSVISDTSGVAPALLAAAYPNGDPFDAADVRNVEVDLRDNDTPGIYVTEVTPGTNTEDGRSLVIEGNATTKLNDELLVQLAKAPDAGDTIVVKLYVNEFSDENIMIYDVDDPNGLDNRMFKGADGYWRITFDSGNWNDAVRVGIEARDDIPREDPHTAAIFFQLDQALTVDANHNYVFPNLRSGPGYVDIDVIDNDSAGAVVLESEGNTLLNGDGSDTDDYTIRLTKAPSTNVSVAVLTDGLADVVSVNGVAVTPGSGYSIIGGLRPTQIFDGNLVFSNEGGLGKITRSTGADLGSFVD